QTDFVRWIMRSGYVCVRRAAIRRPRGRPWSALRRFVLACLVAVVPAMAAAQEASLGGAISDTTGAVLPGVTITAEHQATGNVFVAVTDEKGAFRIPVRTGDYKVTAELQGFTSITRTVQLLVGQTGVVNMQLTPAA